MGVGRGRRRGTVVGLLCMREEFFLKNDLPTVIGVLPVGDHNI